MCFGVLCALSVLCALGVLHSMRALCVRLLSLNLYVCVCVRFFNRCNKVQNGRD